MSITHHIYTTHVYGKQGGRMLRSTTPGKTQLIYAQEGIITPEMRHVANREEASPEQLRELIALGQVIIPANTHHNSLEPTGIGKALSCKVNVNFGASELSKDIGAELGKLDASIGKQASKYAADTVMDLTTIKDVAYMTAIRKAVIEKSSVPVGTVPIYQAFEQYGFNFTAEQLLAVIREQAEQGVDYMTIHAGVLKEFLPFAFKERITKIVSRGGGLIAHWMIKHNKQNPLYTHFDAICDIFREHDVTFSLGDGLRPGCLHDANDKAQFSELQTLGHLTKRAWEKGCQVMIEGPGHIPSHLIAMNAEKEELLCHGAPFYTLGPLVTDVFPGYDHITSAIGAHIIGRAGASLLCYVTPAEHLALPNCQEVKEGLIAYRIAAHAVDLANASSGKTISGKVRRSREWDDALSRARFSMKWSDQINLSADPETAARKFVNGMYASKTEAEREAMITQWKTTGKLAEPKFCSMCGDACPMGGFAEEFADEQVRDYFKSI